MYCACLYLLNIGIWNFQFHVHTCTRIYAIIKKHMWHVKVNSKTLPYSSPHNVYVMLLICADSPCIQVMYKSCYVYHCWNICSYNFRLGGKCSHIVGLIKSIQQLKLLGLTDVPSEQSCTSLPQTWHIPRGNKIKPVPLSQVVVVKAKENRKRAPIVPKILPSTR